MPCDYLMLHTTHFISKFLNLVFLYVTVTAKCKLQIFWSCNLFVCDICMCHSHQVVVNCKKLVCKGDNLYTEKGDNIYSSMKCVMCSIRKKITLQRIFCHLFIMYAIKRKFKKRCFKNQVSVIWSWTYFYNLHWNNYLYFEGRKWSWWHCYTWPGVYIMISAH
jgi:hypothetical protein